MLPNFRLLVHITTITILVVAWDAFVEASITLLTTTIPSLIIDMIFKVLMGLQTPTGGREISNKTDRIMARYSSLMSGVNCAKPLATQPISVLSFKAMNNSLISISRSIIFPQQTLWIGFLILVQINTSHLILQI